MEESAAERGLGGRITGTPPRLEDEVILQGPHIGISHPFAKQPRPSGLHQQDYEAMDPGGYSPRGTHPQNQLATIS